MYAAAILVATAAVGIDTGWRPAKDDPQGVEYIIQIEPELFQRLQDGKTSIEGVLPPDMQIENIRCFRVQIGEGELPREMPERPASFEAPIEESATLRKVEALELNPAPSSSTASTATPPLNALAADTPTPRYNNTLSSGVSNFPSGVTTGGTPLNPNTRTANAADTNPALRGSPSNFSIPGGSTTTPVAPSSSNNRFSTTPLPSNSSTSTTYQGSSGYSSTPTTNQGSEYPAYTSPPLNNNTGSSLNNGQSSQTGDSNYQRFGDNYANPNSGSSGQSGSGLNYNTGNGNSGSGYSSNLNNGSNNNGTNNGSYNNGGLTPINSTPQNQNSQNNNNGNNNGNVIPPSNQQQPNQNYQPQQPNYQQQQPPYQQQPPNPYGQPNYVGAYPPANPYYPPAPYSPFANPYATDPRLAALLNPPAQQQPPAPAPTTTPAASPSPSDRPARDLEAEKPKVVAEPVERPYWMLVIVAFLSLGFNIYMGWMVVDFRTKYRDILAGFRELKAAN